MKGETFDNICGVCAYYAAYGVMDVCLKTAKDRGGLITKAGCTLIQMCVGLGVGETVRDSVRNVRKKVIKFLDESEV
ncbi:MAG: hypothetical protein K2G70_01070 [Turicibacter sp.]|nr:hypothetical protein [Turicibacter sp.]